MYLDTSPSIKNRFKLYWHRLFNIHQLAKEYHWIHLRIYNIHVPIWIKTTKAYCWTCWEKHVNPYNK